jgi:phosphoribosylformylglycinamidine synthase
VVAGVGGYGNSIGIPTVGGEIVFDEMYAGNPLVNVLCLGIARADEIIKGAARGAGTRVLRGRPHRARRHSWRDHGVG